MIPEPKSRRLKQLLYDRPAEWIAVRRSYAAGLTASEIARELPLDPELVRQYLGEGWRKALAERHAKARALRSRGASSARRVIRQGPPA
jgi:hypothetical protein